MTTSGTSAFDLDVAEIAEEAYERCGIELRSGYQAITARRSLNILFQDWINRGVNLWTLDYKTQALASGTAAYTLAADTSDVFDAVITRSGIDYAVERISQTDWLNLPNKAQTGRPVKYAIERLKGAPVLRLWPTPENSTDVFTYYRVRHLEDINSPQNTTDLPRRFLPALCSGLAYQIARKNPQMVDAQVRSELLVDYEADLRRAMDEDRERASVFIRPGRRR